jgi:iron(III) transport system substrate-binding protein
MRSTGIAATIIAILASIGQSATAFDREDKRVYPVQNPTATLNIISTADADVFEPIITQFQLVTPGVAVNYIIASSTQVMAAIYDENAAFDLVISSAMDLQTKLANDGYARSFRSPATDALPPWAKWRNQIFAFTQEPAVLVVSEAEFAHVDPPTSRDALITLLRDNPDQFGGRVGTYDVRTSGLGYLFATQDSRNSESFWRLTEVMGRLKTKLYCCSGDMISDVADGRLAIAYNVLGSYAATRLDDTDGIRIVPLTDFVSVMLRTALIPTNAENIEPAEAMINFLVTLNSRPDLNTKTGLPPIDANALAQNNALRPIRLGPGLLVFLDQLKRDNFLKHWTNSMEQE